MSNMQRPSERPGSWRPTGALPPDQTAGFCRGETVPRRRTVSFDGRIPGRQDVNVLEVLTAAAAVVAAITGLWNTVRIGRLSGRLDTFMAQVDAHGNAPGLHAH